MTNLLRTASGSSIQGDSFYQLSKSDWNDKSHVPEEGLDMELELSDIESDATTEPSTQTEPSAFKRTIIVAGMILAFFVPSYWLLFKFFGKLSPRILTLFPPMQNPGSVAEEMDVCRLVAGYLGTLSAQVFGFANDILGGFAGRGIPFAIVEGMQYGWKRFISPALVFVDVQCGGWLSSLNSKAFWPLIGLSVVVSRIQSNHNIREKHPKIHQCVRYLSCAIQIYLLVYLTFPIWAAATPLLGIYSVSRELSYSVLRIVYNIGPPAIAFAISVLAARASYKIIKKLFQKPQVIL